MTQDIALQERSEIAAAEETWDVSRIAASLTDKRKAIFLRVLASTANPIKAAKSAGFQSTVPINKLMAEDSIFATAVQEATIAAGDVLEGVAIDRAVNGTEEDIYFKGDVIGQKINHHDSLLIRVLEANKREKYSKASEVKHSHEGVVGVAVIPMTAPDLASWEQQSIATHNNQSLLKEPVIDADFTEVPAQPEMKRG